MMATRSPKLQLVIDGNADRFVRAAAKVNKTAEMSAAALAKNLNGKRAGYDRLVAAMDPAYAATLRLREGEKTLSEALKYGEISAEDHARAMRLLKAQYDVVRVGARNAERAVEANNRNMGRYGGLAQQVGYQVGDFAIQVGNGTSAITAFAQQGSQLLGFLGPAGAIGGAALAILAPLIAHVLDLGDEADKASPKVKTFVDAMDAASGAVGRVDSAAALISDLDALQKKYGEVSDEVLELVRAQAVLAEQDLVLKNGVTFDKLFQENPQLAAFREAMEGRAELIADQERAIRQLEQQLEQPTLATVEYDREELAERRKELEELLTFGDIELSFGIASDTVKEFQALEAELRASLVSGDISAQLSTVDQMVEALSDLPDGSPLEPLYGAFVQIEDQLRMTVASSDRLKKSIEDTGTGEAIGFSDLVEKYDRDTQRLSELADDRDRILSAKDKAYSDGDDEAIRQAERMLDAIDGEIDKLTDATGRVEAMQEQVTKLQEVLGFLQLDESGDLDRSLQSMSDQLEGAESLGNQLDQVTLHKLEGQFDMVVGAAERLLRKIGLIKNDIRDLKVPNASHFERQYVARSVSGKGGGDEELVRSAIEVANDIGVSVKDLLTVMSFETGGTLDPWKAGPTTQHGQHRGLIQWGEPQRERYGVSESSTITEQVRAAGQYLVDAGVKAGDGLERIYAAVLAGDANRVNASDTHNGGVIRNVASATEGPQFKGHKARAEGLLRAYAGVREEIRRTSAAETKADRERQTAIERQIKERERELDIRKDLVEAAQRRLSDHEFENTLIGKSVSEQARLRTEYMLTQDFKRRGIDLNEKLLGQEKTYAELIKETAAGIGEAVAQKERLGEANDEIISKEAQLKQLNESIQGSLLDSILAAESFEDAMAGVVKMLARAVLQAGLFGTGPFGGGGGGLLGDLFGAIFPSAKGNVFSGGAHVAAFAKGGVVNGPTFFPMRGTSKTGLMGEAGPEAIMPLSRMPNGKLGVASSGQQSVVMHYAPIIDARGADAATVKRIEEGQKRMQANFGPSVLSTVRDAQKKRLL